MGIVSVPNSLSLSRIVLLIPFLYAVLSSQMVLASVVLLLSYVTDAADGMLARRLKQVTRLGGLIDVAVDKVQLLVVLASLSTIGLFPVWATVLIVGREVVIVVTGVDLMRRGQDILPPSFGGRVLGVMFLAMEVFYLIDFTPVDFLLLCAALAVMSISVLRYLQLYVKAVEEGIHPGPSL
jgi:phosphatidylglycerophosphate synthase